MNMVVVFSRLVQTENHHWMRRLSDKEFLLKVITQEDVKVLCALKCADNNKGGKIVCHTMYVVHS